jgi:hypothetical protein
MMQRHISRLAFATAFGLIPVSGRAQTVRLQIHPRAGDTLYTRLEQQSEITGTRIVGTSETATSVVSSMKLFSRTIVEGSTPTGTTVLAVTDSVSFATSDARADAMNAQTQRLLKGQQVRLTLLPDGTAHMADAAGPQRDVAGGSLLSLVPAALPAASVAVGESWTREMPIPATGQFGRTPDGKLRATFRLDSIGRHADLAYISLRGEITPGREGTSSETPTLQNGTVRGTMVLDRRRGWLTDSRFTIVVRSDVVPPPASGVAVMHFQMKISQRVRTMDKP